MQAVSVHRMQRGRQRLIGHSSTSMQERTDDGVAVEQRLQLLLRPALGAGGAQRNLDEAARARTCKGELSSVACYFLKMSL
jgi:hypothetical protein